MQGVKARSGMGGLPAALEAYGAVDRFGEYLLPAIATVHARIADHLAVALVAHQEGDSDATRRAIGRSSVLLGALKRSVVPGGQLAEELSRTYDYLLSGLREATTRGTADRVAVAFLTMRSLSRAWDARLNRECA